ncbi:metal-dependent hydrolase [Solimonas sp. K1W22B-7]|uniref:metal-dependent hydrolase n=1 Tax=Solimonas sp. K1W22B-7 TaxID=2303331 RepID=UPI000E337520|nr:metal-dependent hydrolase [Solimonas sp. K1W22B-7]AXQ31149.1 metal-dependent hydrolase [Solimonas sp. K1W22B-7]
MNTAPSIAPKVNARAAAMRPPAVSITPQRMGFTYSEDTPRYWFANDPFLTSFWTAFAGQFPQGEKFLIQSARLFRDQVEDKQLQKDISGFIGQEAYHAQEHTALNKFLAARGVPTERMDRQIKQVLDVICRIFSERDQMAMTAALEHFTSMFGSLVLENPELIDDVHPSMRPLFLWHAIEETEHKGVAFDLYQAVDGDHARLMRAYLISTFLLLMTTAYFQTSLLASDRSLFKLRSMARGMRWMFGYAEGSGYLRRMLPEFLDFFRRDFHPWQHDNSAQIEQWKQVLENLRHGAKPQVAA